MWKACYVDFNSVFLSAVQITFVDKTTTIVTWPTFGSATCVHITIADTSGSEKVIAIASRGNQSCLLVTAQWKAATSSLCLLCSRLGMVKPPSRPRHLHATGKRGSRLSWAASVKSSILFKKANFLADSRCALFQQPIRFPSELMGKTKPHAMETRTCWMFIKGCGM